VNGFKHYKKRPQIIHAKEMLEPFQVETLEGVMRGNAGDFLVWGVEGEQYPCTRSVFLGTYQEVTEPE
jgi:hypothetical protein